MKNMAKQSTDTKGRQGRQVKAKAPQQAEQVAAVLAELEAARQAAKERGDAQAMVDATMGKARIAGLV